MNQHNQTPSQLYEWLESRNYFVYNNSKNVGRPPSKRGNEKVSCSTGPEKSQYSYIIWSGHKGGKVSIPDDQIERFNKFYAFDIKRGFHHSISEQKNTVFPMHLDLDFSSEKLPSESTLFDCIKHFKIIIDEFYPNVTSIEREKLKSCIILQSCWKSNPNNVLKQFREEKENYLMTVESLPGSRLPTPENSISDVLNDSGQDSIPNTSIDESRLIYSENANSFEDNDNDDNNYNNDFGTATVTTKAKGKNSNPKNSSFSQLFKSSLEEKNNKDKDETENQSDADTDESGEDNNLNNLKNAQNIQKRGSPQIEKIFSFGDKKKSKDLIHKVSKEFEKSFEKKFEKNQRENPNDDQDELELKMILFNDIHEEAKKQYDKREKFKSAIQKRDGLLKKVTEWLEVEKRKCGYHVIFPNLMVDSERALHLYESHVCGIVEKNIPCFEGCEWRKVCDEQVYLKNGLRMEHSYKYKKCPTCSGANCFSCINCNGIGKIEIPRVYEFHYYLNGEGEIDTKKTLEFKNICYDSIAITCIRKKDSQKMTEGWVMPELAPRNPLTLTRQLKRRQVSVTDRDISRILLDLIRKISQYYSKIQIDTITSTETCTSYTIMVKGSGATYCMNKRGEHYNSAIYFVADTKSIVQKCNCKCPGTPGEKRVECSRFKSEPVSTAPYYSVLFPTKTKKVGNGLLMPLVFGETAEIIKMRESLLNFNNGISERIFGKNTNDRNSDRNNIVTFENSCQDALKLRSGIIEDVDDFSPSSSPPLSKKEKVGHFSFCSTTSSTTLEIKD